MSKDQERLRPLWEREPEAEAEAEATPRYDFFISYTAADLGTAELISRTLREEGYGVQYQHRDFSPGSRYVREINEALLASNRVLAVVSKAYLESPWCSRELEAAHANGKEILPVRIEPVEPGGLLQSHSYIDLFGPGVDEQQRAARLLSAAAGREPEPVPVDGEVGARLPARPTDFTGRKELLADIFTFFHRDSPQEGPRRLTLYGLGGVGKSMVAVEYGYRMQRHYHQRVWFARAQQQQVLILDLRALLNELRMPRPDRPVTGQLREALERQQNWLLIVDDAPDLDAIAGFLPRKGSGHILVTSPNSTSWRGDALEVGGWRPEEAVDYLIERTGSSDREVAMRIADEVDGHPLALAQAASFIDKTGASPADFLTRYRQARGDILDATASEREARTVGATIELALRELETASPEASAVLNLAAFLSPEPVPIDLLRHGLQIAESKKLDLTQFELEIVVPLRRLSLVRREGSTVTLNRLVQLAVRSQLDKADQTERWIESAAKAIDAWFPSRESWWNPSSWPLAARLLPHLLVLCQRGKHQQLPQPALGRLLHRAGSFVFQTQGLRDADFKLRALPSGDRTGAFRAVGFSEAEVAAVQLLQSAIEVLTSAFGRKHREVADSLAELGNLHRAHERLEQALQLLDEAASITAETVGWNSLATSRRLTELGRVQRDAGRLELAIGNLERAETIAREATDGGDKERGEALASLGLARAIQGRHREAVGLLERATHLHKGAYGTKHFEYALTLETFAGVLQDYGDLDRAERVLDEAQAIEREVYGDSSLPYCNLLLMRASAAISRRRGDKARSFIREALSRRDSGRLPDAVLAEAYLLLAEVEQLEESRNWKEPLELAAAALRAAKEPSHAVSFAEAEYLANDEEHQQAAAVATRLRRELQAEGSDKDVAEAALIEALALLNGGQHEAAIELLLGTIGRLDEASWDHLHPLVEAHLQLAKALASAGESRAASEACDKAVALSQKAGVDLQATALLERGLRNVETGKAEAGLSDLERAHRLRRDNFAQYSEPVEEVCLALAEAEVKARQTLNARRHFDQAVEARAARLGAESPEMAQCYVEVAEGLLELGLAQEAATRLREAVRIIEQAGAPTGSRLSVMARAGLLLLGVGEDGESQAIARRLREDLAETELAPFERASSYEFLVRVALEAGDEDEARSLADTLLATLEGEENTPPLLLADCLMLRADAEEAAGNLGAALADVERAEQLSPPGLAHGYVLRRGELQYLMDSNSEAVITCQDLLATTREPEIRRSALSTLVMAALDADDPETARSHIDEWLDMVERDESLGRIDGLLDIARARLRLGDEVLAQETADRTVREFEAFEIEDDETAARFWERMADFREFQGDVSGHHDALQKCADLLARVNRPRDLSRILSRLATASLQLGDASAARSRLEGLRDLLDGSFDDESQERLEVEANVGLRYLDMDEFDHARVHLERALEGLDKIDIGPDVESRARSALLSPLITAFCGSGDLDSAEQFARKAVELSLLSDEGWDEALPGALLNLFGAAIQAEDRERAGKAASLAQSLADRWFEPQGRDYLNVVLARELREREAWPDLRDSLLEQALAGARAVDEPDGDRYCELAISLAQELCEGQRHQDAIGLLQRSAEFFDGSGQASQARVLYAVLGERQLESGDAKAAATAYGRALDRLDGESAFTDRIALRAKLGEALLEADERAEAVATLRGTMSILDGPVADDVSSVEALARLVHLFARIEDVIKARQVMARAAETNERLLTASTPDLAGVPDMVKAHLALADVAGAIGLFERALAVDPNDDDTRLAFLILTLEGKVDPLTLLRSLAAGKDPEALATVAREVCTLLHILDRRDEAIRVAQQADELLGEVAAGSSGQLNGLLLLADLLEGTGEHVPHLEKALELAREHPGLQLLVEQLSLRLGMAYSMAERWSEALEILPVAVGSSDAEIVEGARRELAIAQGLAGQFEEAINSFDLLVDPDPGLLEYRALVEMQLQQYQPALDTLGQALARLGPEPRLLSAVAGVCNAMGEFDTAILFAEEAYRLDPEDPTLLSRLAWALDNAGPEYAAKTETVYQQYLERNAEQDATDLYALKGRANARRLLGREKEASADFQRVLDELEPGSDLSLEGWVSYQLADFSRAASCFEAELKERPDRHSTRFDLALCQAVAGEAAAADTLGDALDRLSGLSPRERLAPLRVALVDLRDARAAHPAVAAPETIDRLERRVSSYLEETESLVVRPILPRIEVQEDVTTEI